MSKLFLPDLLQPEAGFYGEFGGQFVPESLMLPLSQLQVAFNKMKSDTDFIDSLSSLLKTYAGRATPLTEIPRFSSQINGPQIVLKREDLLHTGAHKLNNALGQCLLAQRMGKSRIIAETGAGQHGVATATACAYLGLECVVYMGSKDCERQAPNVQRMQLLGAKVVSVDSGAKTLKDAVNTAMRDYAASFDRSHYCLGSALGPAPFPEMVAYFQSIIGHEAREQCLSQFGQLPTEVVACVGGGSNAIGIFAGFVDEPVRLIGVEAGGVGTTLGKHAARFIDQQLGVLHGTKSFVLQDKDGQIANTHSISAGLDYPSVGPQHAYLHLNQRAKYTHVSDEAALSALKTLSSAAGIIPALESSHAVAYVMQQAKHYKENELILINLSGRGDKDLPALFERGAFA